jgi:hypothetical protein
VHVSNGRHVCNAAGGGEGEVGSQVSFPRQGRKYEEEDSLVAAESGHGDCCPLVVDPKTLLTLLAFLAGATYFLYVDITMNIMGDAAKLFGAIREPLKTVFQVHPKGQNLIPRGKL